MPELRCPFCHEPCAADDPLRMACAACDAPHHAPCFAEGRGCAATGCQSTGARVGAQVLGMPELLRLAEDPQGLERVRAQPPREDSPRFGLLSAAVALLLGPWLVGQLQLPLLAGVGLMWGGALVAWAIARVVRGGAGAVHDAEAPAGVAVESLLGAAAFLLCGLGALVLVDAGRGPLAFSVAVLGAIGLATLALRPRLQPQRPYVVLREDEVPTDPLAEILPGWGGARPDAQLLRILRRQAPNPRRGTPVEVPERCPTCQGRLREPGEAAERLAFCFHCGAGLGPAPEGDAAPEAELAPGEEPAEKQPSRAPGRRADRA